MYLKHMRVETLDTLRENKDIEQKVKQQQQQQHNTTLKHYMK